MRRSFSKLAVLGAALALAGAPAATASLPSSNQSQSVKKDAIQQEVKQTRPMMVKNQSGLWGNETNNPFIDRNQRQYRKLVRQNPWMRKSKKHRSRN